MRTREEQSKSMAIAIEGIDPPNRTITRFVFNELAEAERRAEARVRAEIARDSERLDWRTIESAPKNRSYVDLWVINPDGDGRRITDAYFGPIPHTCGEYGQYCDSCPEEGDFWVDGIFGHKINGEITHWRETPSAQPSTQRGR